MKVFGLLLLALSLVAFSPGCATKSFNYVASGTVRNVWCHDGIAFNYCDVIFEHDSGPLQKLTFYGHGLPLWTGLHGQLGYHSGDAADSLDYVLKNTK